ncbi:MAG: chloride channel protein [Acidobacteria bacterium]|nr:chloride channel protein [Acidobacteriota bacterium]
MPSKKAKIWKAWLPRLLARTRLRERQIFLILTIAIGLVAGLAAVLFTLAIDGIHLLLFGHSPSSARLVLVPTLASLVAGVLLARYFQDARGSGVPQTKAAYHLSKGVIRARTPAGKFLTGSLCIGAGHSLGREGPSVHIGAGLASLLGRWFRLSPASVRNLVPVGAAAALSAAFNTPIAAVLFALEEIVGDLNHAVIGSTVLASVSAVVLERAILGNQPLFAVPPYALVHPGELLAYAVLGVVGGIVSVIFCKGLLRARILFRSLPNWSVYVQPAMGGLLIGLLLVAVPEVMGVGYEFVERALHGQLLLKTLLLLGAMKVVATIISYASGNAGGIFAPALFIGAMVGGATGLLMRMQDLFPVSDAGAYALVGMGTLFAGIIRAPMTSVFMIFELTQDYQIVVPLMIANMISFAISRRFQRVPVYQALLQQDNIHLPSPERRAALHGWRVRDIMNRQMKTLPVESTVSGALERARQWGGQCFPVLDGDALAGLVTTEMLEKALGDGDPERRLDSLSLWNDPAVHIHPDAPLEDALELLSQTPGVLPVTNRSDTRRLIGVITLDSILKGMHASRRF